MKKFLSLLLIVLLASSVIFAQGSSEKKEDKVYPVAVSCDYPPLEYIDDNGNAVGYEVELIKAVAEEMGIKVEIANVSFDGIIAGVQGGQYDIGASGLQMKERLALTLQHLFFNLHSLLLQRTIIQISKMKVT